MTTGTSMTKQQTPTNSVGKGKYVTVTCRSCGGAGSVITYSWGDNDTWETCPRCHGSGNMTVTRKEEKT